MDITKQQRAIVDALEDVKAQDIKVFNTTHLTGLFDRVIIASGTSNRQTRGLASSVEDKAREIGLQVIATEGEETGEWVLVDIGDIVVHIMQPAIRTPNFFKVVIGTNSRLHDIGDIVVHIMQPAIRTYYNLEEIWGDKPVHMKLAAESKRVPLAQMQYSSNEDE